MSASIRNFSVEEILSEDANRWDRRIAADLAAELECQVAEKIGTIPEIRRHLAVKGYRELRARLELDIGNASGNEAIRAMALAMRAFAHERPGLSAATFRNSITDSPEWRREGELLGGVALRAFGSAGLNREQGTSALQILRALVRGFVLHEMAASFLDTVDYDKAYAVAMDVFIRGLDGLRAEPESDASCAAGPESD
jgi:Tetracyclin repressor-like, C-terminal domain